MHTDHSQAADALDQWWDAYQQGEITDGIATDDMHLMQEITAMHAHALSIANEQRIWRQAMAQIRERQERPRHSVPRLLWFDLPRHLLQPKRQWLPGRFQAVAILAIVIVASLLLDLRAGDNTDRAIFAPSAATPSPAATQTAPSAADGIAEGMLLDVTLPEE